MEIYLDNAATTKPHDFIVNKISQFTMLNYANSSSTHRMGMKSNFEIIKSREIIANSINSSNDEIYFTSGATESDNWAIKGIANANSDKGKHIITSKIEHNAILDTCKYLEKNGYDITYLNVDSNGVIKLEELESAIRKDTILISIMFANNEVGSIQPIKEIGEIARKHDIIFHTDATQGYCKYDINVKSLNINALSASSHKIHGLKGAGFLYVDKNTKIDKFMHGGHQEYNMRGGTHNTASIIAMGYAVDYYLKNSDKIRTKEASLRDYLIDRLKSSIANIRINASEKKRLNNNVSFTIKNIDSTKILIALDMRGIYASGGSACNSGIVKNSHVLQAMNLDNDEYNGAIRMSVSIHNTFEELDKVVDIIKSIV